MIDLGYDTEGNWILERVKKARSPREVAERALKVVKEEVIDTVDGKLINIKGCSLCLHGDSPNALEVAKEVRSLLDESGVEVMNIKDYYES